MTLRLGVVPTNGRDCVLDAVASLRPQVDVLAVILAGKDAQRRQFAEDVVHLTAETTEMNVSKWWNQGLEWAAMLARQLKEPAWDVAILNDDVILPPTWMCYTADDMRALGCVASCTGNPYSSPVVHRSPGPVDLHTRLLGCAFVVAGESGLRAEEEMRWYYSDDWLDWAARQLGGMVNFPGCHVTHRYPNQQVTHEISVYNVEDAEKFKQRWGMLPW